MCVLACTGHGRGKLRSTVRTLTYFFSMMGTFVQVGHGRQLSIRSIRCQLPSVPASVSNNCSDVRSHREAK